ncbi:MAG: exo-alpha-sialidase, partial [Gammaproteobacteria bacterium]|nr:exo-alpha-sialidase [Gammaproteobacteria bacterium]
SLLWLDGRNTPDAAMTLRSAVITPNGDLVQEQEVDDTVCDCCQTDVAIAAGGPVAVYRDRTSDEIRDIYITRFRDGRWQTGERLYADNWEIAGCPVNGPSVVASGDQVAVAWFSAANDKPVVRVMRSVDSGVSFADPVEIASGAIKGYVGLAALEHDSLAVSWVAKGESGDNVLQVRSISASGKPGPVIEVATIHQLRVFPQLAFADGHVWLAWTDDDANQRRLVAARVPVSPL